MTSEQVEKARFLWYSYDYPFREEDERVRPYLQLRVQGKWLLRARTSLFLSSIRVATDLGIKTASYSRIERHEEKATIETMRRCAAAMGCEFVYAIRPARRQAYSEEIWRELYQRLRDRPQLSHAARPAELLYGLASALMRKGRFRREMGWTKRRATPTLGTRGIQS